MTSERHYDTALDAQVDAANYGRERAERAKARSEARQDPTIHLKRIVRALDANLAAAEDRARSDYAVNHATVPTPLPARIHPQVRDRLVQLLADGGLAGLDLSHPLREEGETLNTMIARYRADAQADHDRAMSSLAQMERNAALKDLEDAQARLARVNEDYAGIPVADAIEAPASVVAEQPRRGRPPKAKAIDISHLDDE